ncbi:MAG TPA: hypothetical protein PKC21_05035 [Oligoflexia bacterium]|nr:hypothetical protein [Oligoflexia bacterium]HMR24700.1 hypothetical protein [Oligoflexia bacterium]
MKKILLASLMMLSSWSFAGNVKKYCYTTEAESTPYILWSNDTGSQGASAMLADELKSGAISLSGHWQVKPYDALFAKHAFKVGECVLFNESENMTLTITQINKEDEISLGEQSVFPVVHFDLDGRRRFGLIQEESLQHLEEQTYTRTVKVNDILDYSENEKLTLIYVVCPKNREDVCQLAIKHQGQWVMDEEQQIFSLDVLARSNWKEFGFDESLRLQKNGDTPQGIYRIYASIDWKNRELFGGMRRIDLDARYPALNGHTGYQDNKFLMDAMLPQEAYQDYWFNEWPLAHALGRQDLRIHANGPFDIEKCIITPQTGLTFRPTAGCINTGDIQTTQKLLDKLVELNVFKPEHMQVDDTSTAYLWDRAQRYGEVFLIIVDED